MDKNTLPCHVGIIMDGNGRWAEQRNLPRTAGHREGLNTAKRIVSAAAETGIRYLTFYTFSTENWKRTREEVSFLMVLIATHLRKEYQFYRDNGIRVLHCGNLAGLPADVQAEIDSVMRDTASFDRMTVILAINYGGRDEIVRSVNRWLSSDAGGGTSDAGGGTSDAGGGTDAGDSTSAGGAGAFTEEALRNNLDLPGVPDPDLVIRTAGEMRLSNFLIWQSAYAEYYSSPKMWPDFQPEDLREALKNFAGRNRKFGGMP